MTLDGFLLQYHLKNAWLAEKHIQVYVRRSVRMIEGEMVPCLDISSVEVDEDMRGIGIFTGFLKRFEEAAKEMGRPVYIESILVPRFANFLRRRGYVDHPIGNELVPTLYRILT